MIKYLDLHQFFNFSSFFLVIINNFFQYTVINYFLDPFFLKQNSFLDVERKFERNNK